MALSLLQKRAIRLLVDQSRTPGDVADMLDVTEGTIRDWTRRPEFTKALEDRINLIDGADSGMRRKKANAVMSALYDELELKVNNPEEMKKIPVRTLVKAIQIMQNEVRLDTDGDVTQKVGHLNLDHVKERYKKGNSAKMLKTGTGNLVEFPKKGGNDNNRAEEA